MSRALDGAEVHFPMTNTELADAIAVAFSMTQRTHQISAAYPETLKHYHRLLEIQQQRAAQYVTSDSIPVPT